MSHCGCYHQNPLSRREMLMRCANGFGGIALASLLGDNLLPAADVGSGGLLGVPHHPPRARNVIFLYKQNWQGWKTCGFLAFASSQTAYIVSK